MTTHNSYMLTMDVVAAEDLSAQATRFKAITLAGTVVPAATAAGAAARAGGILITSARSGEAASYVVNGVVKVYAGVAISTLGYALRVGSSGFIFAAASGDGHIGRAIDLANSGDLFRAMVDFTTVPAWSGL